MKILPALFISLFLSPLLAAPALAELYQWKDENGRVHFSDKKPGNSPGSVNTLQQPDAKRPSGRKGSDEVSAGNSASPQERQQRVLQVMKQESEQKENERKNTERSRQKREAECNELREHQSNAAGRRLFRDKKDENGNLIYLDDKERDEYDQQLSAAIAEKCQ